MNLALTFLPQLERKKPAAKQQSSSEAKPAAAVPQSKVSEFQNLSSPKALEQLNSHLQCNSYIDGHTASEADVLVHKLVPKPVLSSFPHVKRWYMHIGAISDSICQVWTASVAVACVARFLGFIQHFCLA